MKATLEFDLPEDHHEHLLAIHGVNLHGALWNLDQQLRTWVKHGHKFKSTEEALEYVRHELRDQMDSQGINFDMFG